jgi:hypothetical protein
MRSTLSQDLGPGVDAKSRPVDDAKSSPKVSDAKSISQQLDGGKRRLTVVEVENRCD